MDKQTIIIPAAGMGRRMKSYGPKCLIEVGNQPLITRQFKILKNRFPDSEIIVVVGFDAEKIYKYIPSYVRTVENEFYDETNVVRSLALGLKAAGDHTSILIVYGDLVFNQETFSDLDLKSSFVLIDNKNQMKEEEVGANIVGDYITQFSYGLTSKWAQIAYLKDTELKLFKELCFKPEYKKYYGFEIMNLAIDYGARIKAITPENMIITEIDTSKDIETAGWTNK